MKKNLNRILSLILCLVMCFTFSTVLSAASVGLSVSLDRTEAEAGTLPSTVSMSVGTTSALGIMSFGAEAYASDSRITISEIQRADTDLVSNTTTGRFAFLAMSEASVTNWATVVFTIPANLPAGTYTFGVRSVTASKSDNSNPIDGITEKSVTFTVTPAPEAISGFDLGVGAPAHGATPSSSATLANGNASISWNPADATFKGGKAYTANVTLTAADGYKFSANNYASYLLGQNISVNSCSSVSLSADGKTLTFSYTYPEVAKPSITVTADDITIAAAGKYTGSAKEPAVAVDGLSTGDYVVSYSNNTNAGTTASVTVSPAPNGQYTFTPVTKNFTIEKADQSISGNNITVEVGQTVDLSTVFSAQGTLSYSIANGAAVFGNALLAGSTPGTYDLTVSAAETANYKAATDSFTVTVKETEGDDPLSPVLQRYTLSFDTNGGSAIDSITRLINTNVDLGDYVPAKAGYEFAGWYADKALTEKVTSVKLTANTTVYAKWTEVPADDEACDGGKDCPTHSFTDIDQKQWYHEGVDFVVANGMMKGVGDNKFDPHGVTSRAMIVTILYRLEGEPTVSGDNPFTDVKDGTWYTDAVIWAEANGIVSGYGDGKFGPDDDITREQMARIMYNYAEYKGYDVSERGSVDSFSDAGKISSWATEEMQWAAAVGLIKGMGDGTVAPQGDAERCQVAAIFMRFCEKYVK